MSTYLQRLGLLSSGAAEGSGLTPVLETLNCSDWTNNQFSDTITSIDGVDLDQFSFISVYHTSIGITGAGSGVSYGMQISADGGTTWETNLKAINLNSSSRGLNSNASDPTIHQATGWYHVAQWIQDFNSDGPTTIQSSEMRVGQSGPKRYVVISGNPKKHNAIRFKIKSSANSVKFSGDGTIELVGYRTPKADVQVFDLAASPSSSFYVDIPAGHTIANVYSINVGRTSKQRVRMEMANGGVPQSGASDWKRYYTNQSTFALFDYYAVDMLPSQTSNGYGHATFHNMNIAAPVHHTAEWLSVDPSFSTEIRMMAGTLKKAVAYSQIRIFVTSGTMNIGKIYVQTYNPVTTILLAKDFGADPGNFLEATGLSVANATGLVWGSYNGTLASSASPRGLTMIDGVPDEGTNNYKRHQMNGPNHSVSETAGGFGFTPASNTYPRGSALVVNLPVAAKTYMYFGHDWDISNPWMESCIRNTPTAQNGFRIQASSSVNFNGGIIYLVGYGL